MIFWDKQQYQLINGCSSRLSVGQGIVSTPIAGDRGKYVKEPDCFIIFSFGREQSCANKKITNRVLSLLLSEEIVEREGRRSFLLLALGFANNREKFGQI